MKNVLLFSVAIIILGIPVSCQKDPTEALLPDNVEFEKSVIYLNGEESAYVPDIQYDSINRVMSYGFFESRNQGQLENLLGFGRLPYEPGEFDLTTENILFTKARTSFRQIVSEDLEGYKYKLVDADEGFFHVEYLDTVNMEVKGRFKAKFCRTSKNGNKDLGLPKNIVFQGVFYEKYFFK
jgi:hypothetical protein